MRTQPRGSGGPRSRAPLALWASSGERATQRPAQAPRHRVCQAMKLRMRPGQRHPHRLQTLVKRWSSKALPCPRRLRVQRLVHLVLRRALTSLRCVLHLHILPLSPLCHTQPSLPGKRPRARRRHRRLRPLQRSTRDPGLPHHQYILPDPSALPQRQRVPSHPRRYRRLRVPLALLRQFLPLHTRTVWEKKFQQNAPHSATRPPRNPCLQTCLP